MSRRCSHCGHNGHNSRTCLDKGFKLFGVRLSDLPPPSLPPSSSSVAAAMRKCVSLGNLSSYGASCSSDLSSPSASPLRQPDLDASLDGYVSDDLVHTTSSARERKKGVAWTEEEHRLFLVGLQKLGKGDWRGISRNFVKTRTPTQVASHAQKYFLRRSNLNKRRRRSSLFDITPDTVSNLSSVEEPTLEESVFEGTDVCPLFHQLSLGQNLAFTEGAPIGSAGFPRLGIPLEGFPLPLAPLSLSCTPTNVSTFVEEAGESDETMEVCGNETSDVAENSLRSAGFPMVHSSSGSNGLCGSGGVPEHSCFPFLTLFPLWAGHVVKSSEGEGLWPSESKIVKPTPVIPTAPVRLYESVEISELSLSTTRPVMKPTPLSYKLQDARSRHSAFHTMPSVGRNELDSQGSLSNAISVA